MLGLSLEVLELRVHSFGGRV